MNSDTKFRVSYNQEKLMVNADFRNQFMKRVGEIGHHIELIYDNEPQDVEGAFFQGEYYVV